MRKDPDRFDKRILEHAKVDDRKLVCLACQAIGYSPRDCTTYFCVGSQTTDPHQAGHLKFTNTALLRYKRNAASVIPFRCVHCEAQPTEQRGQKRPLPTSTEEAQKPDTLDVSSLLRTLRHKDSWRCTCKKAKQPAQKMRAKSAIEGKNHDPKCMLTRTSFGEKRWDGKNMGITLEQLQYLADRNLY